MNLVVKAYQPWKTRVLWVLVILGLGVAGWSFYDYGRYVAKYDSADARRQETEYIEIRDALASEIETLREEKAVLQRAAQIERQAYNELDTTLKALQSEILELKGELAFYRGIVSPRDASRGLRLQRFKLYSNGRAGSYRYKVVLTQVLKNDRLAWGQVKLSFEGLLNGHPSTLKLRDVTEKSINDLSYKFKYFQNMEGDINLPAGFEPLRINMQILPRGSSRDMIEKTFDWQVQETGTHVGEQEKTKTDSTD